MLTITLSHPPAGGPHTLTVEHDADGGLAIAFIYPDGPAEWPGPEEQLFGSVPTVRFNRGSITGRILDVRLAVADELLIFAGELERSSRPGDRVVGEVIRQKGYELVTMFAESACPELELASSHV